METNIKCTLIGKSEMKASTSEGDEDDIEGEGEAEDLKADGEAEAPKADGEAAAPKNNESDSQD